MRYLTFVPLVLVAFYFGLGTGPTLTTSKENGYVCWAKPTPEAKKKCEKRRACNGAGTYAWHPNKKTAEDLAIKSCNKEFGSCVLEYCEKQGK